MDEAGVLVHLVVFDQRAAEDELGDCIRLGWYNDEQKLVSPTHLLGSTEQPQQGVEAFAKSRGAEMEIDVHGGLYRFYYKQFSD